MSRKVPKLFTHSDLDGIGCAILFMVEYPEVEFSEIEFCGYKDIDRRVLEYIQSDEYDGRKVVITDISIRKDAVEYIVQNKIPVLVIDHHQTADWLKSVHGLATYINSDRCACGTSLLNRSLAISGRYSKMVDEFVENVRLYDTYEWKAKNNMLPKKLNTLMNIMGRESFIAQYVERLRDKNDSSPIMSAEDERMVQFEIDKEKRIAESVSPKNVITKTMNGLKFAIQFGGKSASEIAVVFLNKYPEYDVYCAIDMANCNIEYRAVRDDINLGKDFAALLGGGGHPKAAGSQFSSSIKENIIDALFKDVI